MTSGPFEDATLLILAHGSTVNAGSAVPARLHAETLRARRLFAAVHPCYWQQDPTLQAMLAHADTPRVFIVPLFTGEGYFVDDVIPRSLALKATGTGAFPRRRLCGRSLLHYCRPVGTHPGMTDVLMARADDVVTKHPFPRRPEPAESALVVIGHGTERTAASRVAVERQVQAIRQRSHFGEVHAAFMEDEPRVADVCAAVRARYLVTVPFFISDGLHVLEDIPVLLGESPSVVQDRMRRGLPVWRNPTERRGKLIWYAPGVGCEPLLTEVILQRVMEATANGEPPR